MYTRHRLVLSGSGLDLYRFAGALRALRSRHVIFKAYAGVSGGSIIASLVAAGYEPGDELENLLLGFTPITGLLDPEIKFPWSSDKNTAFSGAMPWWWPFKSHGLIKGKKLENLLAQKLKEKGVVRFKDFKMPVKVFTTNMAAKPMLARQTEWSTEKTPEALVAPAVMASCRIPGIFMPGMLNGEPHVDGGVWCNFPLDCWNRADSPHSNHGRETIGIYFGTSSSVDPGLGFWPALVNVMIASRMLEDVEDSPEALVFTLSSGNSLDFFISKDKAAELINHGFQTVVGKSF
jgi:predicted acylesterase/phospholipase RssA